MSITTLDGLVNAMGNGRLTALIAKASISTQAAAGYSALWRGTGTPAQGAIPAGYAVCTDALTGALITFTNPTDPVRTYLARLSAYCANANSNLILYDRLAHMGGLSGVTTGNQTVSVDVNVSTSNMVLRRGASDYSEVEWWWEIYTDIGTSAQTCTVTYTNAGGTPSRTTTFSLGGASPLNQDSRTFQIIGASGEYIQSIQTVSIGTTTGTAGSWGITARRRLTDELYYIANKAEVSEWTRLGLPRIHDDACLEFVMLCGTTSTGVVNGHAVLVQA